MEELSDILESGDEQEDFLKTAPEYVASDTSKNGELPFEDGPFPACYNRAQCFNMPCFYSCPIFNL